MRQICDSGKIRRWLYSLPTKSTLFLLQYLLLEMFSYGFIGIDISVF